MNLRIPILFASLCLASGRLSAADVFQPDAPALEKVAAMLAPKPTAFGRPLTDRAAWQQIASRLDAAEIKTQAEALLKAPLSEQTEEGFLDYSRTGNRSRYEGVMFRRRSRLKWFVLAEGIENQGRFIKPLEETIRALAAERTWLLPAHDGRLDNFNGRTTVIDLGAAMLGWELATADWIVGEKFSPEIRALIRQELQRRIFKPYHRMTAGEQGQYWLVFAHNWNSVCLAGVTGAALAVLEDTQERAWFVLAADKYSQYSLKGFTPDGYCGEGVVYWDYGFGHYTMLSEAVRLATRGGMDFLARKEARAPAAYGSNIEIIGGVCPAFADCPVDARPDAGLVQLLNSRLGIPFTGEVTPKFVTGKRTLYEVLMLAFPLQPTRVALEGPPPPAGGLRSWFPDAGVLVCRPAAESKGRFGFAVLGGDNGGNHHHNDLGTYVVVVGDQPVLADIGSEVYTARTFSSHRYDSKALNSFGHPVPLVAGKMQSTGRQAVAKVLRTEFADGQDSIAFDIKSAYPVPTLATLNRTFVFSRRGPGSVTLTDEFEFASPQTFENALLTFGKWEQLGPRTLRISDRGQALRVEITPPAGSTLEFVAEEIKEDLSAHRTPTRVALRLREPVQKGSLVLKISPE